MSLGESSKRFRLVGAGTNFFSRLLIVVRQMHFAIIRKSAFRIREVFRHFHSVILINSESRRLLNKLEFPVPIIMRKTIWHPDKNLLTMIYNNGENVGILLLSAADGSFQTIENVVRGKISSFAWSPDGSHFAFSQSFETGDVVSLEDF